MMIKDKMVRQHQLLATEPSREQIPIGRFGVVLDGGNLPNSVTEDVKGVSLCPIYSARQLRRIHQIAKKKTEQKDSQSEVGFI
jgi:hypothetical protein